MKAYINGKEVKYNKESTVIKKESELARKLIDTSSKATDRLIKLSHEFKAGDLYKLYSSSHTQEAVIPKLNDPVVVEFKQKFYKAAVSSGEALRHIKLEKIDTVTLKSLTSSALSDLNDLKAFSVQNYGKVNSLFEKAYYDTNIDGTAAGIAALFTGGISFFASAIFRDDHGFTGKLGREIEDFNQITSLVSELETYIPHE